MYISLLTCFRGVFPALNFYNDKRKKLSSKGQDKETKVGNNYLEGNEKYQKQLYHV